MKLNPGCKEEYIRRHNEAWPELMKKIKDSGVSDYSIFIDDETDTLFAVQKVAGESMEANPDCSPVSIPLEEVFYLK